jgi:hypothetical protein
MWIDKHRVLFNFEALKDIKLFNKLIDDSTETVDFKKLQMRHCAFNYYNPNLAANYGPNILGFKKIVKSFLFKDKVEYYDERYYYFALLKSILYFKYKYKIPYYGEKFFTTPSFCWIEEDKNTLIFEKYRDNPGCRDYEKYGHIGRAVDISIFDDEDAWSSTKGTTNALIKAIKLNFNVDLSFDYELYYDEKTNPNRAKIALRDTFFRQFLVIFPARLVALDLAYILCKNNKYFEFFCRRMAKTKIKKISYTLNYFENDCEGDNTDKEVLQAVVKQIYIYLKEIFEQKDFMDKAYGNTDKCMKISSVLDTSIVIKDVYDKEIKIDFDTCNFNSGAGFSLKNVYTKDRRFIRNDEYSFRFWDPSLDGVSSSKDKFNRNLGNYYIKEPINFSSEYREDLKAYFVTTDLDHMDAVRIHFDDVLMQYLIQSGNCKDYSTPVDDEDRDLRFNLATLSVRDPMYNQVSYVDYEKCYTRITKENKEALKRDFLDYFVKLQLEENIYKFLKTKNV